jgi:hypothetical protein
MSTGLYVLMPGRLVGMLRVGEANGSTDALAGVALPNCDVYVRVYGAVPVDAVNRSCGSGEDWQNLGLGSVTSLMDTLALGRGWMVTGILDLLLSQPNMFSN